MNERVPDDSCESAFKFLVRNDCVKGRKITGLDACDMVEIWILKMFFFFFLRIYSEYHCPTIHYTPGQDITITV